MIDAIWLLDGRALLDYAKAAASWLLTRTRRNETERTMNTATIENNRPTTARKIGYAITGLVFVFIVCPLFVFGAYTILISLINL
ncbi:MAG: hypothetical protein ACR2QT_02370 [Woeseiaceae bacterium]